MVSRLASYLLFVVFVLFATSALKGETPNLDARRAQLNQLLKDEWEYELKDSPERATVIGDYRYNDRWSDNSLAHVQQVKHDVQDWLSKFESLQVAGFSEQERGIGGDPAPAGRSRCLRSTPRHETGDRYYGFRSRKSRRI